MRFSSIADLKGKDNFKIKEELCKMVNLMFIYLILV